LFLREKKIREFRNKQIEYLEFEGSY